MTTNKDLIILEEKRQTLENNKTHVIWYSPRSFNPLYAPHPSVMIWVPRLTRFTIIASRVTLSRLLWGHKSKKTSLVSLKQNIKIT